ncbi:MAG: tripartite tricarboxylate transporter permease [Treponema sp.]|jgi:putative tricarboxylic transport membrane protein|nr:tripartite tricarboxylate transporter permease [Treponema sp.]
MELLLNGFAQAFNSPAPFLLLIGGIIIGIIFGAIPGLTAGMAVALFLPLTFKLAMIPSFVLLFSLYVGGISGGLISAILLKIPGTPASIATTFDGGPMADRGEAYRALMICTFYSFLGTLFGVSILIVLTPVLGKFALKLGVYELFSIGIFSLTLVSVLCGKSATKGLISCILGLFLACVGAAPIDGFARYTFGFHGFDAGFEQAASMVGLFALSEILNMRREKKGSVFIAAINKARGSWLTLKEFVEQLWNFIRSASVGAFIGVLPGLGGVSANMLAYGIAKKSSKHPEKFGTGIVDGLVASETSNNACIGGDIVPLITLGIPGDTVTAILLGAFIMNGLSPGPMFYTQNISLVYTIFAILLVCSLFTFIIESFGIRAFAQILKIPKTTLLPPVLVLCLIGSFCLNNRMFDVWTFFGWGLMGYIMVMFNIPLSPIIMGYILGPICEVNLRRGLMLSQGSFMPFITRKISGLFLAVTVIFVIWPAISAVLKRIRKR